MKLLLYVAKTNELACLHSSAAQDKPVADIIVSATAPRSFIASPLRVHLLFQKKWFEKPRKQQRLIIIILILISSLGTCHQLFLEKRACDREKNVQEMYVRFRYSDVYLFFSFRVQKIVLNETHQFRTQVVLDKNVREILMREGVAPISAKGFYTHFANGDNGQRMYDDVNFIRGIEIVAEIDKLIAANDDSFSRYSTVKYIDRHDKLLYILPQKEMPFFKLDVSISTEKIISTPIQVTAKYLVESCPKTRRLVIAPAIFVPDGFWSFKTSFL